MNFTNPFGLDLQAHKLPFVGGMFENPDEKRMQQQMHNMANAYAAYRPEAVQARQNALSNQFSLYQPVANTMGQMYGANAVPNPQQAMMSPLSPRMQQIGNPRSGGFAPPQPQALPKKPGPSERASRGFTEGAKNGAMLGAPLGPLGIGGGAAIGGLWGGIKGLF